MCLQYVYIFGLFIKEEIPKDFPPLRPVFLFLCSFEAKGVCFVFLCIPQRILHNALIWLISESGV